MTEQTPDKHVGGRGFDELVELVAKLRGPNGCPWDREQKLGDLPKYLVEEAYELVDAVADDDTDAIEEELGDLLFLMVFFARIAQEDGRFDISSAIARTCHKMVRRHPHVFGDLSARNADEVLTHWYGIKAREKADNGVAASAVGNIPRHLPALLKAQKIQRNVSRVGFDWDQAEQVLAKAEEELGELHEALASGDKDAVADELGDLLFSVANLARFLGFESEEALERTNRKFVRRFQTMEQRLEATGRPLKDFTLDEMNAEWERAKQGENSGTGTER
ncbi:MAG: nucleoside triphosphate pyrophosphohydrolase [Verrucomicrobia bacterium]|nr:nucleoside triphosphate pyrophosphohydrolase [Verrucomicrobiota bacterium]